MPTQHKPARTEEPAIMPGKAASYIYIMTSMLNHFLDKKGIGYYLGAGTLLGAVRDGGIIRHDDDADLHLIPGQEDVFIEQLTSIRNDLSAVNKALDIDIKIFESRFGCKVVLVPNEHEESHFLTEKFESLYGKTIPTLAVVDIFYMTQQGQDIKYKDAWSDQQFGCSFEAEHLLPLTRANFGPLKQLPVPKNARAVCQDMYGENCFTVVKIKNQPGELPYTESLAVSYDKALFATLSKKLLAYDSSFSSTLTAAPPLQFLGRPLPPQEEAMETLLQESGTPSLAAT